MFIVLLHYLQPLTVVEQHLAEHRAFLDRHYAAGHFVASGPQVPRIGGAILARGLSRRELDAVLAEDPFHREKVAQYQVIEFEPNRFAAGAQAALLGELAA
ncbi:YciI family protein [Pelomonas sp. CA6]|uniref:YciI family protein n=1 Tax=Pelomonas sp. CA6 TaxID=2907999 RepID=UPI001F4A2F93|nr:YciI family protein [Pelomonas sp. CA6]MCH7342550.1 YciI family protein [Pelomonas sp. CA6]